ncbi:MAG: hypothetical protein WCH40_09770, partial [Verrucomicrobiales bacterium]
MPALIGLLFPEEGGRIDFAAGADEAVAGEELVAEPRHAGGQWSAVGVLLTVDGVQPERDLGQLDRDRIQIHAEHVA